MSSDLANPHLLHKTIPASVWAKTLGMRQRRDPDRLSLATLARWRRIGIGPPFIKPPTTEFYVNGQRCVKSPLNQTRYCDPNFCEVAKAWLMRYRLEGKP